MNRITAEFVMEKLAQDIPFQQTRLKNPDYTAEQAPANHFYRTAFYGQGPFRRVISQEQAVRGDRSVRDSGPVSDTFVLPRPKPEAQSAPGSAFERHVASVTAPVKRQPSNNESTRMVVEGGRGAGLSPSGVVKNINGSSSSNSFASNTNEALSKMFASNNKGPGVIGSLAGNLSGGANRSVRSMFNAGR